MIVWLHLAWRMPLGGMAPAWDASRAWFSRSWIGRQFRCQIRLRSSVRRKTRELHRLPRSDVPVFLEDVQPLWVARCGVLEMSRLWICRIEDSRKNEGA